MSQTVASHAFRPRRRSLRKPRSKVVQSQKGHDPRLATIKMVENLIKEKDYPSKNELWRSLPKQVQYPTFNRILDHLEQSNKIMYDGRSIVWIFADNPKAKKLLAKSKRLR